jgi:putative spermidine/putrescine transport system permease protein
MLRSRSVFDLFVAMIAVATVLFLVAPLIMVFANSLGPVGLAFFPPPELSFAAYATIPPRWLYASLNSLALAGLAAGTACVFGTCGALAVVRGGLRFPTLVDGLLRSPLQAPSLVLGVAFLQYYAWLSANVHVDLRASFLGLLLAHAVVSLPFVFTVVLARLVSFDHRLEEAAYGLGAGPIAAFFRITLPIIAPAVFSGAFFAFLLSLDNVPLSLFLVGVGAPLLPVDLFTSIQFDLQRTVYAVATLVCIFTAGTIALAYRHLTAALAVSRKS